MSKQNDVSTAEIPLWPGPRQSTPHAPNNTLHAEISALSHTGKVRTNNEDHYLVTRVGRSLHTLMTNLPEGLVPDRSDTTGFTMVVADGMGGHAAGEVASRMAIGTLVEIVLDVPDWIMNLDGDNAERVKQRVETYYRKVDQTLAEHARADKSLSGMGTTMTIAYSIGADLFLAHVGDTRCYLFHDGKLQQLTRDQTQAQMLVDAGLLRREEMATSRLRSVLTNALGCGDPALEVEMQRLHLGAGDRLLLCSDGLTDMVDDPTIAGVLSNPRGPAAACRALVDLALEHGGHDNVTVIVADYVFDSVPERA